MKSRRTKARALVFENRELMTAKFERDKEGRKGERMRREREGKVGEWGGGGGGRNHRLISNAMHLELNGEGVGEDRQTDRVS